MPTSSEGTVGAMDGTIWSRLPEEIRERMLSFLPVPALFRCRSVCKRWNKMFRERTFLELCDLNGRNHTYVFLTHSLSLNGSDGFTWLDSTYRMLTCFLDLDERRWYAMRVDDSVLTPTYGNIPRHLAMNDGLLCEVSQQPDSPAPQFTLVAFDPLANTRWELPADARIIRLENTEPPVVVTAVDDYKSRSYKVFLLDKHSIFMNKPTGFFLYESSSNAWRALENPPLNLGYRAGQTSGRRMEESAVFFQGKFYATFWYYDGDSRIVILSYNLEENVWTEVYAVEAKNPGNPQLIVHGKRLFLSGWVDAPRPDDLDFPQCMLNYSVLQITEILVHDQNSTYASRTVMNLTTDEVEEICGKSQTGLLCGIPIMCNFDISFAFPPIPNEDGFLVMCSRSTGKVMLYDARSASVETFPAHPLRLLHQAVLKREEARLELQEGEEISSHFSTQLMNLSVRNILSEGPG